MKGEMAQQQRMRSQLQYPITALLLFLLAAATFIPSTSAAKLTDNYKIPFGPNISHCNPSYSDAGAPVYCCPYPPESTEPVYDFNLTAVTLDSLSRPPRIRRPAHVMSQDPDYVAKYERAVALMKALPHGHPHNYWRQANMHCIYCTGAYDQVNGDGYVFKIHRSWFFFAWHRAYVFFHERILAKLVGDESFALPYWQWDVPEGMMIPDMYVRGVNTSSLDHHDRDVSHLPPTKTINDYKRVETGLSPDDQVAHNLAFMYNQMVSGASKPELFMGCKLHPGKEDMCNGPGTIESAPHNALHAWVGSNLNPEREDMGAFYAAARDPTFYSHHCNIDRLWIVWRQMHGDRPEIVDPMWLDTEFYFHDENMRFVRIKVRDLLDITKLGYSYQAADTPWMNAKPKPLVDPEVSRPMLMEKKKQHLNMLQKQQQQQDDGVSALNFLRVMAGLTPKQPQHITIPPVDFGPQGRILDSSFTELVPRTPKSQQQNHRSTQEPDLRRQLADVGYNATATAAASRFDDDDVEEVLVVYGIDTKKDQLNKFEVYINVPEESQPAVFAAGPRAREFAGTYVGMRKGAKVVRPLGLSGEFVKTVFKIGISELLRDLQAEEDDAIWVTVVPNEGTGEFTSVEGIRIEYMGWWN